MDLATLGIEIRSDGVVVAKDRLKDFEGQAGRTSKATDMLLKAFGALAAVFSVSKLIQYTNTWTDLNSRIEIATGSIGRGAATMDRLDQMARRTYSSLELTAESFLRNSTAMRDLGYSTDQTLNYVEAINNALVVSGAKGERAESVMNALGKAMALGKLSGDQLETVLASGGRITEALAASLGVTTLELRKMGTEGKLTGDVIYQGLTSQLETLRAEADSMPATIGDAFVLLNNSILGAIGRFDEMSGASSRVAEAIIWVADAIGDGTISIERMLAIAVAMGAYMAGAWVVSFVAAHGAVATLTAGLGLLRAALIRTGIGALIVLAGELVYQLWSVVDGAGSVGEAFNRLKKSGVDTWERIVSGGEAMYHSMEYWALEIASMYLMTWTKIQNGFFDMLRQLGAATGIAIPGMLEWENSIIRSFEQASALHTAALAAKDAAGAAVNAMFEDKSTTTTDLGSMPGFGEVGSTLGTANDNAPRGGGGSASSKADAYDKLTKSILENVEALKLEAETLGMTDFEATKLSTTKELMRAAEEEGRPLTEALIGDINAMAQAYAEAEQIVAGVQLAVGNPEPWEVMREELASLDAALAAGAISWEQYHAAATQSMAGAANSTLGAMSQISGALASAFEGNKAFAVANAIINTAEGVTKALAQGGMFAFPIAAALAVAGAAQVATIMSASPGGGTSVRAPSSSAPPIQNAPQRQQSERPAERMDITLHGLDRNAMYSGENIEAFLRAIEDRAADGRILNIKVA
jgi:tape measure domain-containing protein